MTAEAAILNSPISSKLSKFCNIWCSWSAEANELSVASDQKSKKVSNLDKDPKRLNLSSNVGRNPLLVILGLSMEHSAYCGTKSGA